MKCTRILTMTVLTCGLLAAVGCKHDEATAPPGPGPTALPQSYRGSDIPASGSINTESRMGSDHPQQTP